MLDLFAGIYIIFRTQERSINIDIKINCISLRALVKYHTRVLL